MAAFDTAGNVSAPSAPCARTTFAGAGPGPSVALSSNGQYLVDQSGQPFFINGDAAWSLVAQLSNADADLYLTNRQQKGYNVLLMRLIEHLFSDHAPADFNGDQPFLTPGNFTTPNEAYFAHADWVISEAAARGQVVMLDPLYLGYDCGSQGWCAEVKNSSTATMQSWGTYVGTRYKNVPNIIWVVGGDADPVANNVTSQVQAFATALTQADPGHLVTAHNARGQAAVDPWPNATWLTLNDVYTDNLTYVSAATQATRVPFKPYFLIETYYENEHGSTPQSVRAEAYWDVLSGRARRPHFWELSRLGIQRHRARVQRVLRGQSPVADATGIGRLGHRGAGRQAVHVPCVPVARPGSQSHGLDGRLSVGDELRHRRARERRLHGDRLSARGTGGDDRHDQSRGRDGDRVVVQSENGRGRRDRDVRRHRHESLYAVGQQRLGTGARQCRAVVASTRQLTVAESVRDRSSLPESARRTCRPIRGYAAICCHDFVLEIPRQNEHVVRLGLGDPFGGGRSECACRA